MLGLATEMCRIRPLLISMSILMKRCSTVLNGTPICSCYSLQHAVKILHPLLHPARSQHYALRQRSLNFHIPRRTSALNDNNVINSILFSCVTAILIEHLYLHSIATVILSESIAWSLYNYYYELLKVCQFLIFRNCDSSIDFNWHIASSTV